jgi:multisubunit Na+/H+ antiporter MnhB subunit
MPTLIPVGDFETTDVLLGLGIIAVVYIQSDILLITLTTQIKQALSDTKIVKRLNIITSMGFILIGAFFLYTALLSPEFSFLSEIYEAS